ncbi:MAG: sugar phosphate isomerase/epimerase family protein [Candidatus Brocadiia bacterium]
MVKSGLVSVTFRKLKPREVVDLVAKAKLAGIEWGGDIHVPHGDKARAKEAAKMTKDAGLKVAAYGSYYYAGLGGSPSFEEVLDSALELGAPVIRIWAGKKSPSEAGATDRKKVVDDSIRIAEMAAKRKVALAFEFHNNTLTETTESAVQLLKEIGSANVRSYWQPHSKDALAGNLLSLDAVLPWLAHVHCYQWDANVRQPLEQGESKWKQYLARIRKAAGDRYVMIEFVKDDSPEAFLRDAATLRKWLA